MPLVATCPHCAKTYRLRPAMAGKTVECTHCGDSFTVSGQEAAPAPPPPPRRRPAAVPPTAPRPAPEPQFVTYVQEPRLPRQPLNLSNPYTYVIAACSFLALFVCFIAVSSYWHDRQTAAVESPSAAPGDNATVADMPPGAAAPVSADFPPLGNPTTPLPGSVCFHASFPTGAPSSQTMSLFLIVPDQPLRPLPCVFVAPAGTPLITGSDVGLQDQSPELDPYVRAGFAACTYSLDGPKPERPDDAQLLSAYDKFRTARGGLLNARRAMDFVAARAPMISPDCFFVAGHSSAATLALVIAAREPRVKAVAAYCPCIDITARLNRQAANIVPSLERLRPGTRQFLDDNSPVHLASDMTSPPILLFGSPDDRVVDNSGYAVFASAIRGAGGHCDLVMAPGGDHYQSMIQFGIPNGIRFFLKVLHAGPAAPASSE